ncbi:MAG: hypothetical protein KDA89_20110, partial [Planctomycetaceae bacterium]|nr:hypothetical protein [Planctomycetaceae bacterium]
MLTCISRTASAQPPDDAAKKYQDQQKHLVQDISAIKGSLLTKELKGVAADPEKDIKGVTGEFEKIERTYRSVIRNGTNREAGPDFDALKTGLEYRIFALSDPDIQANYRDLDAAFSNLSRDIIAARSIANPQDQQQFRQMVCRVALPLLEKVINEGNLVARSLAID